MSLHRTRAQLRRIHLCGLNLLASAFLLTATACCMARRERSTSLIWRGPAGAADPGAGRGTFMLFLSASASRPACFRCSSAAGLVSHPAGRGVSAVRRTADESWVYSISVFTLLFPGRSAVYTVILLLSTHHGGRTLGASASATSPVLSSTSRSLGSRPWGWRYDARCPGGPDRVLLHHMLVITALFLISGLFLLTTAGDGTAGARRSVPHATGSRCLRWAAVLAGWHPAALRLRRKTGVGARSSTPSVSRRRRRPHRQPDDCLVDGPRVGGSVLEPAPTTPRRDRLARPFSRDRRAGRAHDRLTRRPARVRAIVRLRAAAHMPGYVRAVLERRRAVRS